MTLDHKADYEVLKKVFDKFIPNIYFNYDQMKKLIKNKKEIFKNNLKIKKFNDSRLWKRKIFDDLNKYKNNLEFNSIFF